MVAEKPRIVIIGAGMAGLAAANKLYSASKGSFDLRVVEGGTRIGGRINTSEFCGDRIEMGATWIHGIGGSPVYDIARRSQFLYSDQPWEGMDGSTELPTTVAEGGFAPGQTLVRSVETLFKKLMDFAEGKHSPSSDDIETKDESYNEIAAEAAGHGSCNGGESLVGKLSVGSFLRQGLEAYWVRKGHENEGEEEANGYGSSWSRKLLEEAVFAMHENIQRTYTSAGDLLTLDYKAESEYRMFPGEEITIAKGYISIIESLASVLPAGLVQLGKKVTKIEWLQSENGGDSNSGGPVKLRFSDGSVMFADHVIVTVSLGVLKAGIDPDWGLFEPPLPSCKTEAIKKLGFGVVNKLFLELADPTQFPFLQMAFHRPESKLRDKKIPRWMRRTATLWPIYKNSKVLLSWFAGEEALELELVKDRDIINGVSVTVSSFLPKTHHCNGCTKLFKTVLKSQWGGDPLFLGSYSYVAVGSSGDDLDKMAEPLPVQTSSGVPLQILFAGEATHRTHYSTTHGAYLSGLREANRLLQHYHCVGV